MGILEKQMHVHSITGNHHVGCGDETTVLGRDLKKKHENGVMVQKNTTKGFGYFRTLVNSWWVITGFSLSKHIAFFET